MKIAIILVGHLRTWEKCKQSFIDTFSTYEPDIYVYTYDTINYKSSDTLKEKDINELLKDIKIKDKNEVLKESQEKYSEYYIENGNTTQIRFPEFCCQYINVKQSGIEYDFVVKTRPDLVYHFNPEEIFNETCKNSTSIYTSNQHNTCDFFYSLKFR